jgi:hypothetical protein
MKSRRVSHVRICSLARKGGAQTTYDEMGVDARVGDQGSSYKIQLRSASLRCLLRLVLLEGLAVPR